MRSPVVPDPIDVPSLNKPAQAQINAALEECNRLLLRKPRIRVELTRHWAARFPRKAGVYALFEGAKPVYVGESINLRQRMFNLCRGRNHTLRRTIAKKLLADSGTAVGRGGGKNLPPEIFDRVDVALRKMTMTAVTVTFGRAEVEEFFCKTHGTCYNNSRAALDADA